MGISAIWIHVDHRRLAQILEQQNWTKELLHQELLTKGVVPDYARALCDERDEPNWNNALSQLVAMKDFDVDKSFNRSPGLNEVLSLVPELKSIGDWVHAKGPIIKLPKPWAPDGLGFSIVAKAEDVRKVLPSIALLRSRDDCRLVTEPLRSREGILKMVMSSVNGWSSPRAWPQDDYLWDSWQATINALDAVAQNQGDYLGVSLG